MRKHPVRPSFPANPVVAGVGVCIALFVAAPVAAQPVTYEGTVANDRIVIELTDEPFGDEAPMEGRFSYLDDGSDIPLLYGRQNASELMLTEERPCAVDECDAKRPALNAIWTLKPGNWPGEIIGERRADDEVRTVTLRFLGDRPRGEGEEPTAYGLFGSSDQLAMSDELIAHATHPYEFAKLNIPLEVSGPLDYAAQREFDGSKISYVIDPRTRFVSARVEQLADGSSTATVNALLEQGHWRKNLAALGCRSLRYVTLRGGDDGWTSDAGSLGGYDDTMVQVTFLSPFLTSYQESGSLWCGGASPTNFIDPVLVDVRRGKEIGYSALFSGWEGEMPPESLVALVRSNLATESEVMDGGEGCSFDDLSNYLAASLTQDAEGGVAVQFGLYGLPTVAVACSRDLVAFSVSELMPYLSPEGKELLGL